MRRQYSGANEDHFDLLPFVTILMGVLGTLLLVTMSLAAVSLGPGIGEGWVPADERGSQSKTPVLFEWDGKALTAQWPDATRARASFVRSIRLGDKTYRVEEGPDGQASLKEVDSVDSTEWDQMLGRIEGLKRTHYALFAVRPSGFKNFLAMAQQFRQREIDIGYEPIEQAKPVRLMRRSARNGGGR